MQQILSVISTLFAILKHDSASETVHAQVRFSEFVKQHLGTWHGAIVEEETNEIVGYHEGFWFYTLGQRRGIMLSGGPWYALQ